MNDTISLRQRRHRRIRAKIAGTATRPRLAVRRTLSGMYGQLIDDEQGRTIVSVDWREVDGKKFPKNDIDRAKAVGILLAQKAKEQNIEEVVFDRGGFVYHGKVQAFAQGARDGGLQF